MPRVHSRLSRHIILYPITNLLVPSNTVNNGHEWNEICNYLLNVQLYSVFYCGPLICLIACLCLSVRLWAVPFSLSRSNGRRRFFCTTPATGWTTTHSRPQRPRSFWSAPRIATSGQVQRHSGFEWICKHNRLRPEPIRFVRLDSEHAQSDGKSVNRGLPLLDTARGLDSWCWPKGARPLGTRMTTTGTTGSNEKGNAQAPPKNFTSRRRRQKE